MSNTVSFDGLGIGPFTLNRVAFSIGDLSVYWYAVIITFGMILAVLFAYFYSEKVGLKKDDILDAALWGIPFGLIGARVYYIIFKIDSFKTASGALDFKEMLNFRNGGLAIYGGIIAAFLVGIILCKVKKISLLNMLDVVSLGFLIGQGIGRWGNFVNCEAYGTVTDLPWGMSINGGEPVHPTFFYESFWCLLGFVLLFVFSRKLQKNKGEVFFGYLAWYGIERFFVEGLRTDSLMLFTDATAESLGFNLRVSQALAIVLFVVGVVLFVLCRVGVFNKLGRAFLRKKSESEEPLKDKETVSEKTALPKDEDIANTEIEEEIETVEEVIEIEEISEEEK